MTAERTKSDFLRAPVDDRGYFDFSPEARDANSAAMQATFDRITHRAIMARARGLQARSHKRLPNWSFAMELFGLGSTYAWVLCENMGIDPDATTLTPWPTPSHQGAETDGLR